MYGANLHNDILNSPGKGNTANESTANKSTMDKSTSGQDTANGSTAGEECLYEEIMRLSYSFNVLSVFIERTAEEDPFEACKNRISGFRRIMEEKQGIRMVTCYKDLQAAFQNEAKAILFSIEDGFVLKGDVRKLEELYRLGLRMLTLTWNMPNEISNCGGITRTGIEIVEKMEELHMLIDISHLPEKSCFDLIRHTKRPFLASHSNAKALCANNQNLSDEIIRLLAGRGGVIGINPWAGYLKPGGTEFTWEDMMAHIVYLYRTGGEDCVAIGSDRLPLEELQAELGRRGFTAGQIEKMCAGNVYRMMKELQM